MITTFPKYNRHNNRPCKWVVYIGGFLQSEQSRTGIEDAWVKGHNFVHCNADENVVVVYKRWNEDFTALAEKIHRMCGQQAKVAIISYSWGTGNGAVSLAKELQRRGILVNELASCDGVYKSGFWSTSWAALFGWPEIVLPDNIEKLWWCRQFEDDLIKGHDIVFEDGRPVPEYVKIDIDHAHIDEADEFQKAAYRAVERLVAA